MKHELIMDKNYEGTGPHCSCGGWFYSLASTVPFSDAGELTKDIKLWHSIHVRSIAKPHCGCGCCEVVTVGGRHFCGDCGNELYPCQEGA